MTGLFEEAAQLQSLLERENRDFYFVGGIALQIWGEPRLTTDIDLTVFTNLVNEDEQIAHFASFYRIRSNDAHDPFELARVNRILLLETESKTGIDLMLSGLADISEELRRSSYQQFAPHLSLRICSADTLIAYKTVAGRLKDLADIESIIIRQRDLDWDYIYDYLNAANEYKDISAQPQSPPVAAGASLSSVTADAIIIGGGAAGLFCAAEAGKRGKRIVVLERNAQVGRKIIISGGGRCNFTNLNVTAENFVSQNPHFAKSALARYTPQDFIDLVRKHKIPYYEKKLGQLFCRESSKQIVEMLLAECRAANVKIVTGCSVENVEKGTDFVVKTDNGDYSASRLIIAPGGLSFAKVGATDLGYRIARQFGLEIVETRPSLVPLVLAGESYRDLAGVSADVRISTNGIGFRENILFTHRGMSGPAILQISNYWSKGEPISIDLVPDVDALDVLTSNRQSTKHLDNFLAEHIPARVAERLMRSRSGRSISSLSQKDMVEIAGAINNWKVRFTDTEGYDKAEVTLGGVSTDEISSKTFEAKKVPGLFFIGEVVDVTGWLGGYNFQWAWSSGHAAAQAI